MAQNSLIQVRVDDDLKLQADTLFSDLGLDTPTAIRMFLKQSLMQNGLPFDVVQAIPNAETLAAMKEAKQIAYDPDTKRYSSFASILSEVENDV